MFKLTGTIKVVKETVKVTEKFSKREFVITTKEDYPQDVSFQLTQDKCNLMDLFGINQEVEVSFNLRGREWTSPQGEVKYFNTLDAWKIQKIGNNNGQSKPVGNIESNFQEDAINQLNNELEDDLPF